VVISTLDDGLATANEDPLVAHARLYGEPLLALPQDLYIPPDALKVFLEAFEGPLDLLLYLIRQQDFNIFDIPMATVTQQYLRYIDDIRATNLELAADYLLMAAMLIDIKSRLLLPRPNAADDAEAEDPRAELTRRLLEYERIKQAAQLLNALPQVGRDCFPAAVAVWDEALPPLPPRFEVLTVVDLQQAWAEVRKRAQWVQHHHIAQEELSVRELMVHILQTLKHHRFVEFADLFDPQRGIQVAVVTFIAVLELVKEGLIELTQAIAFAPIYVRLTYKPLSPSAT
jgi:segregation and condensation protein A